MTDLTDEERAELRDQAEECATTNTRGVAGVTILALLDERDRLVADLRSKRFPHGEHCACGCAIDAWNTVHRERDRLAAEARDLRQQLDNSAYQHSSAALAISAIWRSLGPVGRGSVAEHVQRVVDELSAALAAQQRAEARVFDLERVALGHSLDAQRHAARAAEAERERDEARGLLRTVHEQIDSERESGFFHCHVGDGCDWCRIAALLRAALGEVT